MRHPLASMYRLAPRNGPGLTCDEDGVALGPAVLVERIAGPSPTYRCRPRQEIERALALAYGSPAPAELGRWHAGLDAAARALQTGDVARAAVIAVQLRLPTLMADSIAKLTADPHLKKYSPDQPRDERGRWTSEGSSSAHAPMVARDTNVMSDADEAPSVEHHAGDDQRYFENPPPPPEKGTVAVGTVSIDGTAAIVLKPRIDTVASSGDTFIIRASNVTPSAAGFGELGGLPFVPSRGTYEILTWSSDRVPGRDAPNILLTRKDFSIGNNEKDQDTVVTIPALPAPDRPIRFQFIPYQQTPSTKVQLLKINK